MNYIIKNEFLELAIATKGAEKISLVSKNASYLRELDDYWDRKAPFLFPIVGALKDGFTIINNKKYYLSQHGFLRDQEFEVLQIKDDEISLVNVFNDKTLKKYPFKYKVIVTYKLETNSLDTQITVYNEDDKDMPFNIGGHPGFKCPIYEGEKFSDYRVIFEKPENFVAPSVVAGGTLNFGKGGNRFENLQVLNLDYKYFENDAIVIPRVKSKSVMLVNRNNLGIKFEYPNFLSLALWTKVNAPFLCLEPWIGYADRDNTDHEFIKKDNIIILKSLESFNVNYKITILE